MQNKNRRNRTVTNLIGGIRYLPLTSPDHKTWIKYYDAILQQIKICVLVIKTFDKRTTPLAICDSVSHWGPNKMAIRLQKHFRRWIFVIYIEIPQKCVIVDAFDSRSVLVPIMDWHRTNPYMLQSVRRNYLKSPSYCIIQYSKTRWVTKCKICSRYFGDYSILSNMTRQTPTLRWAWHVIQLC